MKKMRVKVVALLVLCGLLGTAIGAELKYSFPLNEGDGAVIHDTGGNFTGQITGGSWQDGHLYLDGHNSYIDIPNSKVISDEVLNDPCSIELWFKPDESKNYREHQWLVASGWEGIPGGFSIEYQWHLIQITSGDAPQWQGIGGKGRFSLTEWNHLAMTVDEGGNALLYINGVNVKIPIDNNGQCKMASSGEDLIFGGYANHKDYQFKGGLAGIKFYKGALTAGEVNANYSKGMSTPKVTIDGKLDESIWQNATTFNKFYQLGGNSDEAEIQTKSYITADKDYLYAAVECFEPNMKNVKADVTEDGSLIDIYRDDSIEFMLDADSDPTCYYHFILNANGVHAQIYKIESGRITTAWNADKLWKSAAKKYNDKWIVEFSIPHAILSEGSKGICKNPKVNFARNRRAGKQEESSILKSGEFHVPTDFVSVSLNQVEPDKYLIRIGQKQLEAQQNDAGQLVVTLNTSIINNDNQSISGEINVAFENEKGGAASGKKALTVKPGSSQNVSIPVILNSPGNYSIKISFAKDNSVMAMRQFAAEEINFVPLTVVLDKPFYRNNFYHTEQADEVISRIKVNFPELTGVKIKLAMISGKKEIASKLFDAKAGENLYKLSFDKDLPIGEYKLNVSVIDADGKVGGEIYINIKRLPKAAGTEIRCNKNLTILMNGKPFFPIIESSAVSDDDGANCVLTGQTEDALPLMNSLQKKGKYALYNLWSSGAYKLYVDNKTDLTPELKAYLRKITSVTKDHPNMYAYWIGDEPSSTDNLMAGFLGKVRMFLAEIDPYHPGIITDNAIAGFSDYDAGRDISMPDPYPLFIEGGTSARGLDYQSYLLAEALKAGKGRKPVGIVMQTFSYGDFTQKNGRAPSYVEFRSIFYNAAIHGAKSLFAWGYNYGRKYAQLRVGQPYFFKEAVAVAPTIISGELLFESNIIKEGIDYRILKYAGDYYVIACNSGSKTLPVGIKLPAECNVNSLNIVSAGAVSVKDGVIDDELAPFASKIYTSSDKYEKLTPLKKIKKAIENAGGVYECKY